MKLVALLERLVSGQWCPGNSVGGGRGLDRGLALTRLNRQRRTIHWEIRMNTALRIGALVLGVTLATTVHASSLTPAFEAACERTPELEGLVARREEYGARRVAADALLPGGPWTTVTHRTDALTHDRGTREYTAEFTVPVWLRGERGAALAAALTASERLEAEIAFRRLDVARRVRDAYWLVSEARQKVAIAARRRSTALTLAQSIQRQAQAAQADLLETKIAKADVGDAEAALAGRQAELNQALIAFRVLTGQEPPPAFNETDLGQASPDSHPRVVLRRKATEKAQADKELVYAADRERPELGVFATNSRDTSAEPNVTSLGIRLKVPFAYDAINQPKRAAATAEVIAARAELNQAEREVSGDAAQARARFQGSRQQLAALEGRFTDLAEVVQLSQRSQQTGQLSLTDLIRARLQLYEADLARATARVAVDRARSDLNQALGREP